MLGCAGTYCAEYTQSENPEKVCCATKGDLAFRVYFQLLMVVHRRVKIPEEPIDKSVIGPSALRAHQAAFCSGVPVHL